MVAEGGGEPVMQNKMNFVAVHEGPKLKGNLMHPPIKIDM